MRTRRDGSKIDTKMSDADIAAMRMRAAEEAPFCLHCREAVAEGQDFCDSKCEDIYCGGPND